MSSSQARRMRRAMKRLWIKQYEQAEKKQQLSKQLKGDDGSPA